VAAGGDIIHSYTTVVELVKFALKDLKKPVPHFGKFYFAYLCGFVVSDVFRASFVF